MQQLNGFIVMRKYTHVKRVGCLLLIHYTVLNSFENKKGIIKIVSETLVKAKPQRQTSEGPPDL